MKICIIIGTRPEIIKMAPIIRACEERAIPHFILHTGQHYSYELDKKMFEDLNLSQPRHHLTVAGKPYHVQLSLMVQGILDILDREKPDVVLVQGDTNSVLAGALGANKRSIPIGHVEAGLRSHDLRMLEEINRIITDQISDYLFLPTKQTRKNVQEEAIDPSRLFVTGNTVVDAIKQNKALAEQKSTILKDKGLKDKAYLLVTAHRAENVDDKKRLKGILDGLKKVHDYTNLPLVYPIHPRTKNKLARFGLDLSKGVMTIGPVGYLDMIALQAHAKLVLTDSGGLQEEACVLGVPCVTMRDSTERPETLEIGSNMLAGTDGSRILLCTKKMLGKKPVWKNPFGDGRSAQAILDILEIRLSQK
ncbi:UDP-N-acetylglucosamine 2-epimerase (non-hydrolyzing) [archaeon CG10_big_fil_rev_8_21_14_0_10_43_11]|nr:MAG: UDP-N-acetylglucosamine 2-epimerase (non-hydrolyzing) [archaeon CG10_big_fil_rev_8_21_14_0_10_43_11]